MKPWDIIGWLVLGVIILLVLLQVLGWVIPLVLRVWEKAATWHKHKRDRLVPPAPGQVWLENDGRYSTLFTIVEVAERGVCMEARYVDTSVSGMVSRVMDPHEDWPKRVDYRKLYLIKKP